MAKSRGSVRRNVPLIPDKRRHPRIEKKIALKISSDHGDILTETKNISCRGAYCRMSQKLLPMTKLRIHLLLPAGGQHKGAAKKISCEGVVVRVEAPHNSPACFDTAIFFNNIAAKDVRILNEFIDEVMEKNNHGKLN